VFSCGMGQRKLSKLSGPQFLGRAAKSLQWCTVYHMLPARTPCSVGKQSQMGNVQLADLASMGSRVGWKLKLHSRSIWANIVWPLREPASSAEVPQTNGEGRGWGWRGMQKRTNLDGRDPLAARLQQHADAAGRDALPKSTDHASRHEDVLHRGRSRLWGVVLWSQACISRCRKQCQALCVDSKLAAIAGESSHNGSRSSNGSKVRSGLRQAGSCSAARESQTQAMAINRYSSDYGIAPCSNYRNAELHAQRWLAVRPR